MQDEEKRKAFQVKETIFNTSSYPKLRPSLLSQDRDRDVCEERLAI